MTEHPKAPSPVNEGEGSQTAAIDYNERTRRFIQSADVEALSADAAAAIEGPEADELREADELGRSIAEGGAVKADREI